MTRLPESSSWEEEIELISRNERVSGGLDGVANRPLKILASRTRYLRDQAETADESIAEKVSAVKTFAEGATLESPREEILFDSYRLVWTGEFPKTVLAGSTPQGSGGIGAGRWAYTSDAVIRQDLSSREYGLGAYLDGWARNDSCEVAANVAVFLSAQKINLWEYKHLCVPKEDDPATLDWAPALLKALKDGAKKRKAVYAPGMDEPYYVSKINEILTNLDTSGVESRMSIYALVGDGANQTRFYSDTADDRVMEFRTCRI
ncbi:hypothetical protein AB8S94_14425, partial [Klebsiella quasipneumoniae]